MEFQPGQFDKVKTQIEKEAASEKEAMTILQHFVSRSSNLFESDLPTIKDVVMRAVDKRRLKENKEKKSTANFWENPDNAAKVTKD